MHAAEVEGDCQLGQHDIDELIRSTVHSTPRQRRWNVGFEIVGRGLGEGAYFAGERC
jgi:hypothetical protein